MAASSEAPTVDLLNAWGAIHGEPTPGQLDLLRWWIRGRIFEPDAFEAEDAFWLMTEWNGKPTLLLLAADRIVTVQLDRTGTEMTTQYRKPPTGGVFTERWRHCEGDFELTLVYEHDDLPVPLEAGFCSRNGVEELRVGTLRRLFMHWRSGGS